MEKPFNSEDNFAELTPTLPTNSGGAEATPPVETTNWVLMREDRIMHEVRMNASLAWRAKQEIKKKKDMKPSMRELMMVVF